MEPENFQKENKNTLTNILLFLLLLVMVSILFFLVKSYQKENVEVGYIPNEEAPVNNPVGNLPSVTPNPTPGSNPTPVTTTQQNIPLVGRQSYTVLFNAQGGIQYKYCGEREFTTDDTQPFPYYYFLSTAYDCADMEPGGQGNTIYSPTSMFRATAKATTTEAQIKALNDKYGVTTTGNIGNKYTISTYSNLNLYNVYTLAKIYFDSGLFASTELFDFRLIN